MRRLDLHAEPHQGGNEQGDLDDIGRRRRQAHAQHDSGEHGQDQRRQQHVLRRRHHHIGEGEAEAP